jgi:hypothetical protein
MPNIDQLAHTHVIAEITSNRISVCQSIAYAEIGTAGSSFVGCSFVYAEIHGAPPVIVTINANFEGTGTPSGMGDPLFGDRSAWDTEKTPEYHARDIDESTPIYHLPSGASLGDVPIWEGTKWGLGEGGGGGGSATIDDLTSLIDGVATDFTTSSVFPENKTLVYLNGLLQVRDVDYTEGIDRRTIEMTVAPIIGDTLIVVYGVALDGTTGIGHLHASEDLSSQVDGVATDLIISGTFIPTTTVVHLNGLLQVLGVHYTENADCKTIEFVTAPVLLDNVIVGYEEISGIGVSLSIEELDGTPSVAGVSKIYVPNGSLTDNGDSTVNLGFVTPTMVGVRAYRTTNQAIGHSSWVAINFDAERFDTDTFHDNVTNNTRLTVPVGKAGYYLIIGDVSWASNVTGFRYLHILLNGSVRLAEVSQTSGGLLDVRQCVSTIYHLSEGDYVQLEVHQTSGGDLDVNALGNHSPEFMMSRIGI